MRNDTFKRINGKRKNVVVLIAVVVTTAMLLSVSLAWFADAIHADKNSIGSVKMEVEVWLQQPGADGTFAPLTNGSFEKNPSTYGLTLLVDREQNCVGDASLLNISTMSSAQDLRRRVVVRNVGEGERAAYRTSFTIKATDSAADALDQSDYLSEMIQMSAYRVVEYQSEDTSLNDILKLPNNPGGSTSSETASSDTIEQTAGDAGTLSGGTVAAMTNALPIWAAFQRALQAPDDTSSEAPVSSEPAVSSGTEDSSESSVPSDSSTASAPISSEEPAVSVPANPEIPEEEAPPFSSGTGDDTPGGIDFNGIPEEDRPDVIEGLEPIETLSEINVSLLSKHGIAGVLQKDDFDVYELSLTMSPMTDISVFSKATYAMETGLELYNSVNTVHFIENGSELEKLFFNQNSSLSEGDTIVLLNDMVVDTIQATKPFNLSLAGHKLIVNYDFAVNIPGESFGTMDLAYTESERNAQGRKGEIAVGGETAINAPGIALRWDKDKNSFSQLSVRSYNGEKFTKIEDLPIFMSRSIPLPRSYEDINASEKFTGDGTPLNPYIIANLNDYKKLEQDVNAGLEDGYAGKNFKLITDLDFTMLDGTFPPIGGNTILDDSPSVNAFKGTFDGDGHQLVNLKIDGIANNNIGVFGAVEGGTVKNLMKSGGYVTSGGNQVGGIVGLVSDGASIRSCIQTAPVNGLSNVGGIAGSLTGQSTIVACYDTGTINKPIDPEAIAEQERKELEAEEEQTENDNQGVTSEPENSSSDSESSGSVSSNMQSGETTSAPTSSEDAASSISSSPISAEVESSQDTVSSEAASSGQEPDRTPPTDSSSTSSEPKDEQKPSSPQAPDITYDFHADDPYIGGIVGMLEEESSVKYSYSLNTACRQALGLTEEQALDIEAGLLDQAEVSNASASETGGIPSYGLVTIEQLRSSLIVRALNTPSPAAYKPGYGAYPYPQLSAQAVGPNRVVIQGKIVHVSGISTSFDELGEEEFTGDGTENNPYRIESVENYKYFIDSVAAGYTYENQYIKLATGFDFSNVEGVLPIGGEDTPFSGIFDGGGNIISNLNIDLQYNPNAGIFGYVSGGTVRNLAKEGGTVVGGVNVGGIVGLADNAKILNCYHTGTVQGNNTNAGGIVGSSTASTVAGCYNTGAVSGTGGMEPGGIIGYSDDVTQIMHCYSLDTAAARPVGNLDLQAQAEDSTESDVPPPVLTVLIKTEAEMLSSELTDLLNQYEANTYVYQPGSYPILLLS